MRFCFLPTAGNESPILRKPHPDCGTSPGFFSGSAGTLSPGSERLDIGDDIGDLIARQAHVGHLGVRIGQERRALLGGLVLGNARKGHDVGLPGPDLAPADVSAHQRWAMRRPFSASPAELGLLEARQTKPATKSRSISFQIVRRAAFHCSKDALAERRCPCLRDQSVRSVAGGRGVRKP
jgi:hypothetical protein